MRAVYVWNGGSMPLEGKTYAKGEEIPPEIVDGLRSKKALLSIGKIKMVTVEEEKSSSATAKKKTAKKSTKKKTTKKAAKPVVEESVEEPVEDEETAPEEE